MILYKALVIGASAGGVNAMRTIIAQIGVLPWPILLVQHMQAGVRLDYAAAFGSPSHLKVIEAEDKMRLEPGVMYVAPPGYHALIEQDGSVSLSLDAPVNYSRPSIDVLFDSAAEVYGASLIGVLLSGANHDGAAGLESIHQQGGLTIAQDPATAEVPTMPASAIARFPVDHVLPLQSISSFLNRLAEVQGG